MYTAKFSAHTTQHEDWAQCLGFKLSNHSERYSDVSGFYALTVCMCSSVFEREFEGSCHVSATFEATFEQNILCSLHCFINVLENEE